jgi:hypothetical protein
MPVISGMSKSASTRSIFGPYAISASASPPLAAGTVAYPRATSILRVVRRLPHRHRRPRCAPSFRSADPGSASTESCSRSRLATSARGRKTFTEVLCRRVSLFSRLRPIAWRNQRPAPGPGRTLSRFLRGEERFENARKHIVRNADAGIVDGQSAYWWLRNNEGRKYKARDELAASFSRVQFRRRWSESRGAAKQPQSRVASALRAAIQSQRL